MIVPAVTRTSGTTIASTSFQLMLCLLDPVSRSSWSLSAVLEDAGSDAGDEGIDCVGAGYGRVSGDQFSPSQ